MVCLLSPTYNYIFFVDWFFFQRTEADCRRLLEQAGFDSQQIKVSRDETRIIMNFVGQVATPATTGANTRVDPLHVDLGCLTREVEAGSVDA